MPRDRHRTVANCPATQAPHSEVQSSFVRSQVNRKLGGGLDLGIGLSRSKRNPRMLFLYAWILVVSLSGLQSIVPMYSQLYVREIMTAILILLVLTAPVKRAPQALWGVACFVIMYTLVGVARSDLYGLARQAKLFVRLIMMMIPIFAVPVFARSWRDLRNVLLFAMFVGALISLSGPFQQVYGRIPWLYAGVGEWEWAHGRAGFARYLSIYGDPNIGGMLGAILPISLIVLRNDKARSRPVRIAFETVIWAVSIVLVVGSMSLAATLVLLMSMGLIWVADKKYRLRHIVLVGVLAAMALAWSSVGDRLTGVLDTFLQPSSVRLPGVTYTQSLSHLESDLEFRLFSYLDVNDTPLKVLFGSSYNVVVPSGYYNPSAILAHNGYKELYLAGGLVGLGLYLVLLLVAANQICAIGPPRWLVSRPCCRYSDRCSFTIFIFTVLMLFFPINHYNGVGIVMWTAIGVIFTFYVVPCYPGCLVSDRDWLKSHSMLRIMRILSPIRLLYCSLFLLVSALFSAYCPYRVLR